MLSKTSEVTAISMNAVFLWFVMPMHLKDMYRKTHALMIMVMMLSAIVGAVRCMAFMQDMCESPFLCEVRVCVCEVRASLCEVRIFCRARVYPRYLRNASFASL